MSVGQISIERQCLLAFRDALGGAVRRYLDNPQDQMAHGIITRER